MEQIDAEELSLSTGSVLNGVNTIRWSPIPSDPFDIPNPGFQKHMQDCFGDIQSRMKQMDAELSLSALGPEDLDMYVLCLKEELGTVEQESSALSDEIIALSTKLYEDSSCLECNLTSLDSSSRQIDFQDSVGCQDAVAVGSLFSADGSMDYNFKTMELDSLTDKTRVCVAALEDIKYDFERNEAMQEIEDIFSDVNVMDFEQNCIRLTMKTCIKPLGGLLLKFNSVLEPSTFDHQLLIEVTDGNMELKSLKIFPTDVPLDDVVDHAISARYSLGKVISHVQQKVRLSILRRLLFKIANDSRYSFDYMDRDEMITAHLVGGIDAYIKLSQGWPVSSGTLQLISIKSSSGDNSISLSLLCRLKELANSLDPEIRWDLSRFIGAIEEILICETQSALECGRP